MKEIKILIADHEDGDIFNGAKGIIKYGNVAEELMEFIVDISITGTTTIKIETCGRPHYCGLDNVRYKDQYRRTPEEKMNDNLSIQDQLTYQPIPIFPSEELKKEDSILIDGIVAGLKAAGVYGEDISQNLIGELKQLGRYDLLPNCER